MKDPVDAIALQHLENLMPPTAYQPEHWVVKKDTIYFALPALESGIEYARECLAELKAKTDLVGRKNQTYAARIEADIRAMEKALAMLKAEPVERKT